MHYGAVSMIQSELPNRPDGEPEQAPPALSSPRAAAIASCTSGARRHRRGSGTGLTR